MEIDKKNYFNCFVRDTFFINFLAKKKLGKYFYQEVMEYLGVNTIEDAQDYVGVNVPRDFICSAFNWAATDEGTHFWKSVQDEWRKECDENKHFLIVMDLKEMLLKEGKYDEYLASFSYPLFCMHLRHKSGFIHWEFGGDVFLPNWRQAILDRGFTSSDCLSI